MHQHTKLLCLIVVICAVAGAAHADFADRSLANTSLGIGMRAMGMGDAAVAVADDVTALYWNPAGLAASNGLKFHVISIGGAVDNIDVIDDLGEVADIIDLDDTETISAVDFNYLRDVAVNTGGTPIELQFSLMTGLAYDQVALGGYVQSSGLGRLDAPGGLAATQVNAEAHVNSFGAVGIGYGWQINRRTQVGVAVKQATLVQTEIVKSFFDTGAIVETSDDTDDDNTLTGDVGIRYRAEDNLVFGAALRNVTSPDFNLADLGTRVKVDPSLHIGLAATDPERGWTFAADLHNLTSTNDTGATFHVGLEKMLSKHWAVRGGFRDGDFTWGVSGTLGPVSLAVASGLDPDDMFAASFTMAF
jgi:outer membrane protein W